MLTAHRAAALEDIPRIVELLLADAALRSAHDPFLWALSNDAEAEIAAALRVTLTENASSVRHFWQVAEHDGRVIGVAHSILLPVPPIYAGKWGQPGLILADCAAVEDAPPETEAGLLAAAEATLRAAGARLTIAAFVTGKAWQSSIRTQGFAPLTLYLARSGLTAERASPRCRKATEADLPGIVAQSAENRDVLFALDPFWEPHPEADARFAAWMGKSLTMSDRDMFVSNSSAPVDGYLVAQPASRLHFPAGHDISRIGSFDDFYHSDLRRPLSLAADGVGATELLRAGEAALAKRGARTAFVVCPAAWRSKQALLEAAGYKPAMLWSIKR